ncbi:MAG: heavy metal translocating P-type ATPase [Planctomycetota bacterium]|nr:heavy metal translocating P-type ATPase [Planctomycetota bacterium]
MSALGIATPPRPTLHPVKRHQPRNSVLGLAAAWLGAHADLATSLICGVLLATAWLLPAALSEYRIAVYCASYGFGVSMLVARAVEGIRQNRFALDVDVLMVAAAIGAAAIGHWAEGGFLLFLFSLANALEHYALGRASQAIRALADLSPPTAFVLRDGIEVELPLEEVMIGDVVVVRPAERIAVDGSVLRGESSVDQAPITGESVPVAKAPGDAVFAGTVNGAGALEVTTTRAAGDRTLDRVVAMVEAAQSQQAPTQVLTDRITRVFVPLILVADVLLIVVPALLGLLTWTESFYRGMTVLVGASPCALALGTPAAVLAGIAQAARNGVLIKGGAHLENLGLVKAIAFDKTGTLTSGEPNVTDLAPMRGVSETELLLVASAVEQRSQHPLAEAVVRRARAQHIVPPAAGELQSITAKGVRATVAGQIVEIGSLRMWEHDVAVPDEVRSAVINLQAAGRSTLTVRSGDRWLGVIGVMDKAREHVGATLRSLKYLGIERLIMLTGDNQRVGEVVGREVGIDSVMAELLPEGKVEAIQQLQRQYGRVAMIGDGVNDAPALAHATVGIAMGGAGTAVALETADVALMGDDLSRLPFAVSLSRQARRIIRQNLYFAIAVIVFLIIAGSLGIASIGPAVVMHEGSTIVVIINALRLLTFTGEAKA